MILRYKIKELREDQKISQRQLSEAIGHSDHTRVLRWENNKAQAPFDELEKIATVLNKNTLELFEIPAVRLVGEVGAGGHITSFDCHDDPEGPTVEGRADLPKNAVAVRVSGDSMYPRYFDGEIIYYADKTPIDELLMTKKDCAVQLANGDFMVKILRPGSEPGKYNLESWNSATIENAEVLWAAKILGRK